MKVAIIGDNPATIEISYYFSKMEAQTTTFYSADRDPFFQGAKYLNCTPNFSLSLDENKMSLTDYYKTWLSPMLSELSSIQVVKKQKVQRVQKRFLHPTEVVPNKSRLYDLFRVVYLENPSEVIEEQKKLNPQVYENIASDVLDSLKVQMEGYEDFDLVIDTTAFNYTNKYLANGALALGEFALQSLNQLSYGFEALDNCYTLASENKINAGDEYAIVGSSELAAMAVNFFTPYILEGKLRVFVVTNEASPFEGILQQENELSIKLKESLNLIEANHQKQIEVFTKKHHEWMELDDFVQVKMPKPVEPICDLVYFSGHNVSAIDRLVDKNRFFLTCEFPEFRVAGKGAENSALDLKTIGVDQVFCLTSTSSQVDLYRNLKMNNLEESTLTPEPGFYMINQHSQLTLNKQLDLIVSDVEKYFTSQA